MKFLLSLAATLLFTQLSKAQNLPPADTSSKTDTRIFTSIEQIPEFPGGNQAFGTYLSKNLKYPEVAKLIGIKGRLMVSFIIERDGSISTVRPMNCIGAGCEAEAVKLIENSPKWVPGMQKGRPVRVAFTVPMSFIIDQGKVTMKALRKSNYGFVFNIKGSLYTIDEAEKMIGSSFTSTDVDIAQPFFNYNKIEKFDMPDKKEVYLIILKTT